MDHTPEISLIDDSPEYVEYVDDSDEVVEEWENAPEEPPLKIETFPVNVEDPLIDHEHFDHKNSYVSTNIMDTMAGPSNGDAPLPKIQETYMVAPQQEEIPSQCSCRDESATFGQYVANKLRKLDERSRALVQHEINNLLFKAEMAMLDAPHRQ